MRRKASYQEEMLEWKRRQLILRKKYADTPAGYLNADIQEREEQNFLRDEEKHKKHFLYEILTDYTETEEIFVGRTVELAQMEEKLRHGTGRLVLYGIGGIGKSALARACIHRMRANYDHILYLTMESGIVNLICSDYQVPISGMEYSKERYGSRRRYYRKKCDALTMAARRERILLILDDCNHIAYRDLVMLLAVPCQMIITTRLHPEAFDVCLDEYPMDFLPVTELQTEGEWEEFIEAYQSGDFTEEEYEEMREYQKQVCGHTLLMMLKIRNPQNVQLKTENFARDLFARFALKQEEKEALMFLSVLPVQGIPGDLFLETTGVGRESLMHLVRYLFVHRHRDGSGVESFSMHPVIAKAARRVYHPTAVRCSSLLRGFERRLKNTWNQTRQQNQQMEPYVFALIRAFPEPVAWMATAFDALATFLWIQEYFQESLEYSRKIFESVNSYYGEPHQLTGQMALRTAEVYHNALEFDKAKPWYERGLKNLEQAEAFNIFYEVYLAGAYEKMARIYRHEKRYEEALGLLGQAENVLRKLLKKQGWEPEDGCLPGEKNTALIHESCLKLSYIHLEMVKNKIMLNKPECAAAYYRRARMELNVCSNEEERVYRLNEFRSAEIELCLRAGNFGDAEKLALCNLNTALRFRGETYKDTLFSREQMGDCLYAEGKYREACIEYEETERILKRYYPEETNWKCRLREKIAGC